MFFPRKRVFILGPSHHHYFEGCAVSPFETYATPLGPLEIDQEVNKSLLKNQAFTVMNRDVDKEEHSIEMHLPYIYKVLERQHSRSTELPQIVPILVGSIDSTKEKEYGKLLRPYLEDEENCFVISSDFCHWYVMNDFVTGNSVNANQGESLLLHVLPTKTHA